MSDYGDYLILNQENVELHFFSFAELAPQGSDFMIYLRIDNNIEEYYQMSKEIIETLFTPQITALSETRDLNLDISKEILEKSL